MPRTTPRYPREVELVLSAPTDGAAIGTMLRDRRDRLENGRTVRQPTMSTVARYIGALGWEIAVVIGPKSDGE